MKTRLLRPADVAEQLGLHRNTVYALVADGTLPHVRIGRRVCIVAEGLEAWIRGSVTAPSATVAGGPQLSDAETAKDASRLARATAKVRKHSAES